MSLDLCHLGQFFNIPMPLVPSLRMGPASSDCSTLCDSHFSFYCLVAVTLSLLNTLEDRGLTGRKGFYVCSGSESLCSIYSWGHLNHQVTLMCPLPGSGAQLQVPKAAPCGDSKGVSPVFLLELPSFHSVKVRAPMSWDPLLPVHQGHRLCLTQWSQLALISVSCEPQDLGASL